jgi:hypothetical protein
MSAFKNLTQALKNTNKEQSNIKDILENILKTLEHLPDKKLVQSAVTTKKFDSSSPIFWVQIVSVSSLSISKSIIQFGDRKKIQTWARLHFNETKYVEDQSIEKMLCCSLPQCTEEDAKLLLLEPNVGKKYFP